MRWLIDHADDIDRFIVHAGVIVLGVAIVIGFGIGFGMGCAKIVDWLLRKHVRPMSDQELKEVFYDRDRQE